MHPRRCSLIAGLGALLLAGCGRVPGDTAPSPPPAPAPAAGEAPTPGPPPTAPEAPQAPPAAASDDSPRSRLSRAEDLFNRGENDLACDQVRAVLRGSAPAPPDQQERLQRLRQACPDG